MKSMRTRLYYNISTWIFNISTFWYLIYTSIRIIVIIIIHEWWIYMVYTTFCFVYLYFVTSMRILYIPHSQRGRDGRFTNYNYLKYIYLPAIIWRGEPQNTFPDYRIFYVSTTNPNSNRRIGIFRAAQRFV
jgi:hypothetical protein